MPSHELPEGAYAALVRQALDEDVGTGDVTTLATVPDDTRGMGRLLAKSPLVLAGLDVACFVFRGWGVATATTALPVRRLPK